MRITGITLTKKGRYALFLDGEFAFSLHPETYLSRSELKKDAEVSEEMLASIRQQDEFRSAKEKALDCLDRSEYTSFLLRQKLLKFYSPEACDAAVQRMVELGLINDLDYGRRFAADCIRLRQYPLRRVRQELQKRGIAKELQEEILAEYEAYSQTDTILVLLRKKYADKLGDYKARQKAAAALARRGFPMDEIRDAMKQLLGEQETERLCCPESDSCPESDDAKEVILRLLNTKYQKNLCDRKGIDKTIAALARRGYPLGEIRDALKAVLEEDRQEDLPESEE